MMISKFRANCWCLYRINCISSCRQNTGLALDSFSTIMIASISSFPLYDPVHSRVKTTAARTPCRKSHLRSFVPMITPTSSLAQNPQGPNPCTGFDLHRFSLKVSTSIWRLYFWRCWKAKETNRLLGCYRVICFAQWEDECNTSIPEQSAASVP